jgi:RNA-binding protein
MPALPSTSPKKKSLMPAGELRRRLRGAAHALPAVVHVGKEGVTPGLLGEVKQALFDHELIKVRIVGECPESRFEVAERLAAQPGVNVVQILGRVVAIYKRHPQKPRYEAAGAAKAQKASPKSESRSERRNERRSENNKNGKKKRARVSGR